MIRVAIKTTGTIFFFLLFVLEMSAPGPVFGDTCSDGTGVPPFLGAENVQHNLLFLIDNSYSMYDLVYTETRDECFDDSF
ncbi:MAG: hypothetical protein N2F24_02065, partial [Deltaproteobacteria bacterium]